MGLRITIILHTHFENLFASYLHIWRSNRHGKERRRRGISKRMSSKGHVRFVSFGRTLKPDVKGFVVLLAVVPKFVNKVDRHEVVMRRIERKHRRQCLCTWCYLFY